MAGLGTPVLHLRGTVRRVHSEDIATVPADPERGTDRRPGYTLHHFTVDTGLQGYADDAGVADVTLRGDSDIADSVGTIVVGEVVTFAVRPYLAWVRYGRQPSRVIRYAVAERIADAAPRRVSAAPAAS